MPADNPPTTPFENETPLPSWETLDFGAGLQELTILRAVEEYLSYHGFNATLKTLRGEVAAGSGGEFNSPDLHAQPSVEKMLSAFDEGRDNLFFRMWGRLEGQAKIANVGSLELRLRVFFATYSMRERLLRNEKLPRQVSSSFDQLKEYLAEHQQNSSPEHQQMVYYALPFVPAPHLHPELKHIFSVEWVSDLRRDTLMAAQKLCAESGRQPRYPFIYSLIEGPVVPLVVQRSGMDPSMGAAAGGVGLGSAIGVGAGGVPVRGGGPLNNAAAAQLLGVGGDGSSLGVLRNQKAGFLNAVKELYSVTEMAYALLVIF